MEISDLNWADTPLTTYHTMNSRIVKHFQIRYCPSMWLKGLQRGRSWRSEKKDEKSIRPPGHSKIQVPIKKVRFFQTSCSFIAP